MKEYTVIDLGTVKAKNEDRAAEHFVYKLAKRIFPRDGDAQGYSIHGSPEEFKVTALIRKHIATLAAAGITVTFTVRLVKPEKKRRLSRAAREY